MSNQLAFMRSVLYDAKKNFGKPVDLYVQTMSATDLTTGSKTITRIKYCLDRVPILPVKFFQQGFYSAAYLKAARQFAYGAYQDIEVKDFVIDADDLPVDFKITPENYLVHDHKRYEIFNITAMEENLGQIVTAKRLTGTETDELHEGQFWQTLRIAQNVTTNQVFNRAVTQTLVITEGVST